MLTKKSLFRVLALLVTGSLFLPIVFKNLPFPLHSPLVYIILWHSSLLIFYPKLYLHKLLFGVYIFVLIYLIGITTFWSDIKIQYGDNIDLSYVTNLILLVSQPLFMYAYFISSGDRNGFLKVALISLLFIFISSVTSLIGLHIFPGASRSLAQGSASLTFMFHELYQKIGIINYSYYSALAFLMPALAFLIKNENKNFYKIFYIVAVIVCMYSLIKAEHTTIIIFAVSLFLLGYIAPKDRRKANVVVVLLAVFGFIFSNYLADMLNWVGDLLSIDQGAKTSSRIYDLATVIKTKDFDPTTGNTYLASERISRSLYSWKSFMENPLIGDGKSAGHTYWLDTLARFGVLGIIPWVIIFNQFIKMNRRVLNNSVLFLFNLSFVGLLLFGLIKNLGGGELWMVLFFVLPGIYLRYDKSNLSEKSNIPHC